MRARSAVIALVLAAAIGAGGCGSEKPEPTMSPGDTAAKEVCFTNQRLAMADVLRWVDGGGRPIAGATAQGLHESGVLSSPLVCPAGGDFVFVPTELGFDCSVHGMVPR